MPVRTSRYTSKLSQSPPKEGPKHMAIHLTPTELAREAGLDRRYVIDKCMQMGVPIFEGRIDKTLFMTSLHELGFEARQQPASA